MKPEETHLQWLESRRRDLVVRMYSGDPIDLNEWWMLNDLYWAFSVRIKRELQKQLDQKREAHRVKKAKSEVQKTKRKLTKIKRENVEIEPEYLPLPVTLPVEVTEVDSMP